MDWIEAGNWMLPQEQLIQEQQMSAQELIDQEFIPFQRLL